MDNVHVYYFNIDEVINKKRENLVVLINDKSSNVIIFSCKSNLKFTNVETILADGTFDYCKTFFQ